MGLEIEFRKLVRDAGDSNSILMVSNGVSSGDVQRRARGCRIELVGGATGPSWEWPFTQLGRRPPIWCVGSCERVAGLALVVRMVRASSAGKELS